MGEVGGGVDLCEFRMVHQILPVTMDQSSILWVPGKAACDTLPSSSALCPNYIHYVEQPHYHVDKSHFDTSSRIHNRHYTVGINKTIEVFVFVFLIECNIKIDTGGFSGLISKFHLLSDNKCK